MPDLLAEQIKQLSPERLTMFKRQLSSLPAEQRKSVYSRLSGIEELADIIGRSTPVSEVAAPQPQTQPQKTDQGFWQKALNVVNTPFDWLSENVTEPFGAIVTSPFTPHVAGKPGESWLAQERREYEQWEEPEFTMPWGGKFRPTKGVVEFLPWLAPTALSMGGSAVARTLGTASKLGSLGKTAATIGRATESVTGLSTELGKVGGVGSKLGKGLSTAAKVAGAPMYLQEQLMTKALQIAGKGFSALRGVKIPAKIISEIAKEQNLTPEFVTLQLKHPVRIKGFKDSTRQEVLDYFAQLKKYSIDDKLFTQMIRAYDEGDNSWAAQVSEGILNQHHVAKAGEAWADLSELAGLKMGNKELAGMGLVGKEKLPTTTKPISEYHNINGGSTWNLKEGNLIGKKAFSVSAFPERNIKIKGSKIPPKILDDFVVKNDDLLSKPGHSVGTWFDKATGMTDIDVVLTPATMTDAMDLAGKYGQKAIYDLRNQKEIFSIPKQTVELTHYSAKPGLKTLTTESMGAGQSGSEAKILRDYKDYFDKGIFAKRIYAYLPEQPVEPRFKGQVPYKVKTDLRLLDPTTITDIERERFLQAYEELTKKLKSKLGAQFGGLPGQAKEIEYATAKSLGYDAVKNRGSVAVFTDIPTIPPVKPPTTKGGLPPPWDDSRMGGKGLGTADLSGGLQPPAKPIVPETPAPAMAEAPVATTTKGLTSQIYKSGFTPTQEQGILELTQVIKEAQALRASTEAMYTPQRAERIFKYEAGVEKKLGQGWEPEKAMQRSLVSLRGELERPATEVLQELRAQLHPETVQDLFGLIARAPYKSGYDRVNTFIALQDLLLGRIPQEHQLALLEETFGSGLVKAILDKRSLMTKAREFIIDLANAPRALLSSGDISGLLRQGGILSVGNKREALRSIEPMMRAMFSDKNEALMDSIIRSRAHFTLGEYSGLYIAPRVGSLAVSLSGREEAFMSRFMNKIPFVKASNRAYVTGLNDLRSQVWEKVLGQWEKAGIKYGKNDAAELAQFINWATGRGTLPKSFGQSGSLLNAMFFSPRLIFSRLQLPTLFMPQSGNTTKLAAALTIGNQQIGYSLARKEAVKTMLQATAIGAGLLTAAVMSGQGTVELDPRSADFGKLKVGNTRLDIWTGYTQYIRLAAQLATGERKTEGGTIIPVNRGEIAGRFGQTKFSPAAGLLTDWLKGETYLGEALPPTSTSSLGKMFYERLTPLAIQDLIDGVTQDGFAGGVYSSVGLLGIGVTTYTDEVKKVQDKAAQQTLGMTWDEVGQKYGRLSQLEIYNAHPEIMAAEKGNEKRFSSSPSVMSRFFQEGESIDQAYQKEVNLAAKEFKATGNGTAFKDRVNQAAETRRQMYGVRETKEEFVTITTEYNRPLTNEEKAKMNPMDVLRREYYQVMFGADMYDQFGRYRYDEAEKREQDFLVKYGQSAINYIEAYQGARWADKPAEMKQLEAARELLRPYWKIESDVWSRLAPELKVLSDEIEVIAKTNPRLEKTMLYKYPTIIRARADIARQKKILKDGNKAIALAYNMFYR